MRVLVATNQLQGNTPGDYANTVEGELVLVEVAECDRPDDCGCGRGWPGMASRRATTTAMVVELEHLSEADLRQAIADWMDTSGWADLLRAAEADDAATRHDVEAMLDAIVDEHLELIAEICETFPVGSVLERNGTIVQERSWRSAA